MQTITIMQMVVVSHKIKDIKSIYLLYAFFFLLVLLYLDVPLVQFFFLLPLLHYIKITKKLDHMVLVIGLVIVSIINFSYFTGYGIKFMIVVILSNLLFFLPFIYVSRFLIKKRYFYLSIPSFFYLLFIIFSYTIFNNFWLNYSSFLYFISPIIKFIGSFGLTYLLILFNTTLYYIINRYFYSKKKNLFDLLKKNTLSFSLLLILTFIFFISPIFNYYYAPLENSETVGVALIQGNLDQHWVERIENQKQNIEKYITLTKQSLRYSPDIIVWPEYTLTNPIEYDIPLLNEFKLFSKSNNLTLIIGSIKLENTSDYNSKRYNTLYIFDKGNLYLYNAYEPVTIFDDRVAKAKTNSLVFEKNNSLGLFLCYEENFPYLFAKNIDNVNAKFFIVSGNQYYISNNYGLYLTSVNSHSRAAEFNRYLLRLETSGLTKVIDNNGLVKESIPLNQEGILYFDVPKISKNTFYAKNGDIINYLSIALALVLLLLAAFSVRNRN